MQRRQLQEKDELPCTRLFNKYLAANRQQRTLARLVGKSRIIQQSRMMRDGSEAQSFGVIRHSSPAWHAGFALAICRNPCLFRSVFLTFLYEAAAGFALASKVSKKSPCKTQTYLKFLTLLGSLCRGGSISRLKHWWTQTSVGSSSKPMKMMKVWGGAGPDPLSAYPWLNY